MKEASVRAVIIEQMDFTLLSKCTLMKQRIQQVDAATGIGYWSRPSGSRGGDFIIRRATADSWTAVLGDASGHGEAGARVADYLRPILQREIAQGVDERALRRWNRLVYRRFQENNSFVCVTIVQLHLSTGKLTILNGGNPEVLLRRAGGGLERYPGTGMPLGILDDSEWLPPTAQCTHLGENDYVLGFTDGLVDSIGRDGDRFGLRRVCTALHQRPGGVLRSMRRSLRVFESPTAEQDDVSMLILCGGGRAAA